MLPLVGRALAKALYIWLWAGPHKAEGRGVRESCGECELGDRILYLTLLFYSKKSLPPCKWKMGWGTGGEISWAILRAISCREKEGKNLQSDFVFVSLTTSSIFLPLAISFCTFCKMFISLSCFNYTWSRNLMARGNWVPKKLSKCARYTNTFAYIIDQ